MPVAVPPLPFFCINVLARFPDQLHQLHQRRVSASPALLDALLPTRDPCLWAALAQLVRHLPPHLHELDVPLSHPALPLLQKIPDSPNFSLVTLLSLPNCIHLRDDNIANLCSLHRLLALDLRGCSITPYAITALARSLAAPAGDDSTGIGTWGLRLLSLHGCANIDNDVLPTLHKFPLLSAVDLRFTRCTTTAVNAHLSFHGFRPSDTNSLFYPAPLSLALCTLEKVAVTVSHPISLYSCPPQSVFRVYIDELDHSPPRPKKPALVGSSSTSHPNFRITSSADDNTVVFIPPLRKVAENELLHLSKSFPFSSAASVVPALLETDQSTHSHLSNVSSFYENATARHRHYRKNILPLSAQTVQSSESGKLDPLAIARLPPPWTVLDSCKSAAPPSSHAMTTGPRCTSSANVDGLRWARPIARWTGQALNNPLKVDRARLHRRGSDAVADMVHQFASKRLKVKSEFAQVETRVDVSVRSRNPFARIARSVSAEGGTGTFDKPRYLVHESLKEVELDTQPRICHSLPSQTVPLHGVVKPLKPITALKPPVLPKELLCSSPRYVSKPKTELRQTRLAFTRARHEGGVDER